MRQTEDLEYISKYGNALLAMDESFNIYDCDNDVVTYFGKAKYITDLGVKKEYPDVSVVKLWASDYEDEGGAYRPPLIFLIDLFENYLQVKGFLDQDYYSPEEAFYELNINDCFITKMGISDLSYHITRVPGGWMYMVVKYSDPSNHNEVDILSDPVFVPFSDEFKEKLN